MLTPRWWVRVRANPSGPAQARDPWPLGSALALSPGWACLAALLDLPALLPAVLLSSAPNQPGGLAGVVPPLATWAVIHLLVGWFLGAQASLRHPWWPRRRLAHRHLLVALVTLLVGAIGCAAAPSAVPQRLLVLLPLALPLGLWSMLVRLGLAAILQGRIRRPAREAPAASHGRPRRSGGASGGSAPPDPPVPPRQLLLLFAAYHPSTAEVEQLSACLSTLPASIGYAVVVNDHRPGEAVERLVPGADAVLWQRHNPGYGRAVNRLVAQLDPLPPHIAVLNTDLSWRSGSFEALLDWLQCHPDVSLAVPRIVDPHGVGQKLCKQHPTLLGLCSRRFLPERFKPAWLKRYDRWYVMADRDYDQVFEVPYLSGCCMLINSKAFCRVGGFDEQYFLYLEDADLSRCLAAQGLCLHVPVAAVEHGWGRGNYRSFRLMLVNLISAWLYFRKWGWALW